MAGNALKAWRKRREIKQRDRQIVERLDRLARQQWHEDKRQKAVEDIKREKASRRRMVHAMPLTASQAAVLQVINGASYHYRGYCAYPMAEIGQRAGVSERTASRHVAFLEENGLIERSVSGRGRGLTNIFRVCWDVIRHAYERIKKRARFLREKPAKPPRRKPAKWVLAYIRDKLRPQYLAFHPKPKPADAVPAAAPQSTFPLASQTRAPERATGVALGPITSQFASLRQRFAGGTA